MVEKTVRVVGSGTLGLAFTVTGSCMAVLARNPAPEGCVAAENPFIELAAGDVLVRANGGAPFSTIGGCGEGSVGDGGMECSELLAALHATKLRQVFLRTRPDLSDALSDGEIASAIVAEYDPAGSGQIKGDARARFKTLVLTSTIEQVSSLSRPLTLVFCRPGLDRTTHAVPPRHNLIRLGSTRTRTKTEGRANGSAIRGDALRGKTSEDRTRQERRLQLASKAARQREISKKFQAAMLCLRVATATAAQSLCPAVPTRRDSETASATIPMGGSASRGGGSARFSTKEKVLDEALSTIKALKKRRDALQCKQRNGIARAALAAVESGQRVVDLDTARSLLSLSPTPPTRSAQSVQEVPALSPLLGNERAQMLRLTSASALLQLSPQPELQPARQPLSERSVDAAHPRRGLGKASAPTHTGVPTRFAIVGELLSDSSRLPVYRYCESFSQFDSLPCRSPLNMLHEPTRFAIVPPAAARKPFVIG